MFYQKIINYSLLLAGSLVTRVSLHVSGYKHLCYILGYGLSMCRISFKSVHPFMLD